MAWAALGGQSFLTICSFNKKPALANRLPTLMIPLLIRGLANAADAVARALDLNDFLVKELELAQRGFLILRTQKAPLT